MEYVFGKRQVIFNFSENFCKNETEVLSSECFADIWSKFVDHIIRIEKQDVIAVLKLLPKPKKDFIILFRILVCFSIEEVRKTNPSFKLVLDKQEEFYELIENFYDYWRRLERYGVIYAKNKPNGVASSSFIEAQSQFNNVILKTYRTISEKVFGSKFYIYRQLPAGVNAALLLSKHIWMKKDSPYLFLSKSDAIEQILIRPPFISYSAKNTRSGTFPEVYENPILALSNNFKPDEFYCYSAYVGSSLAYVYFHRDYLAHGITLCNLFEFVPLSKCAGQKPELLYVFGANIKGEPVFHHDKENDMFVGIAPHGDAVDYFGYMKKMLLTLYNTRMIEKGNLPIHGACVNLTMRDGSVKNIVIIGDSGAGKSESLEALSEYAGDDISSMVTVFDDMGTFKIENGKVIAYGTEIGAFVRLDDMTAGYAYKEMDRAIFMNPDKVNSRLVVPVATYPQIMKGYEVDFVLYANNYDEEGKELSFFDDKQKALDCFIRGARKAKGTTQEIGLVESFFANPFGPVQREAQTRVLLDQYFQALFDNEVAVGQLYTKLAVVGLEHDGPGAAAKKLFELLGQ